MTRLNQLTTSAAAVLLALTLVATSHPDPDTTSSASWGSSLAIRDPDPGFWRPHAGDVSGSARTYAVGMSSLAAMTRIAVAPGDDLELTNLGASGVVLLESGALVLTNAEGLVALQRGGEVPGLDPAPVGVGAMLMRGDRIAFRSSATVALRNPEATAASLVLTTDLAELPLPAEDDRAEGDAIAYCPGAEPWRGRLRLAY